MRIFKKYTNQRMPLIGLSIAEIAQRTLDKLGFQLSKCSNANIVQNVIMELTPTDTNHKLVRIGGNEDGSYLLPNDLSDVSLCFSPGVNETSVFEEALLDLGIKSYLADFSVDGPPDSLKEFDFIKKYVGASASENTITLDDWVNNSINSHFEGGMIPENSDLILQMDIESAEYEVLLASSFETIKKFRIIALELHQLHKITDPFVGRIVLSMLQKINQTHQVVHVHPNNAGRVVSLQNKQVPELLEVTWLRKDRIKSASKVKNLPHHLDITNSSDTEDFNLPEYWYR